MSPQTAALSGISYDAELIPELLNEHRTLKQQLKLIAQLAASKQMDKVQQLLKRFKSALITHVYQENLKLYIYLQASLKGNLEETAKMRALRKEMEGISVMVMDFLDKYEALEKKPQLHASFMTDFAVVKSIYLKRIQREDEELFPMYQPLQK